MIAGGWALDLHEGSQTRLHKDVDVAMLRGEHEELRPYLGDWDLQIAYGGELRPWEGGAVGIPENAVWARPPGSSAWVIDFKLEQHDEVDWIYRRDAAVRRPLAALGKVVDGIPVLDEEIVRLYARL